MYPTKQNLFIHLKSTCFGSSHTANYLPCPELSGPAKRDNRLMYLLYLQSKQYVHTGQLSTRSKKSTDSLKWGFVLIYDTIFKKKNLLENI